MLSTVRRCSTKIPQWISSSTSHSRAIVRSVNHHASPLHGRLLAASVRQFQITAGCRQQHAAAAVAEPADTPNSTQALNTGAHEPVSRFEDLATRGLVDKAIIDNITRRMGLEDMTEVQRATIHQALKGTDIIGRAKTGTGKTIAFLLPVLQKIILEDPSLAGRASRKQRTNASDIRAIIISPTRELAEQIANEARRLTENTKIIVQCAVGGTQKKAMLLKTQREGCHVLVATPGRLNDILSDRYSGVQAPYLDSLVFDEADRLLDDGFWPQVQATVEEYLPRREEKDRQTLMFSATMPREVIHIVRQTLKPGFDFVDCVGKDEVPTHQNVEQRLVQANYFENQVPALVELCQREIEKADKGEARPFKAIVFFNATAQALLASSVLRNLGDGQGKHPLYPAKIIEIHSRLSQMQRTKAAENFRNARSAILMSSDVTARGMDFPDVTHVIQIGLPKDRDTYIHRLGRTARAGKEGQGWLILSSLEAGEIDRRLYDLPLKPDNSLSTAHVDMSQPAQLPARTAQILKDVGEAHKQISFGDLENTYRALLGVFGWVSHKQKLVDQMNRLSRFGWAMANPPSIRASIAQKLGFGRVSGLNLSRGSFDDDGDGYRQRSSFGSSRGSFNNSLDRESNQSGDALSAVDELPRPKSRFAYSSGGGGDRSFGSRGGYGRREGHSREQRSSTFGGDRKRSSFSDRGSRGSLFSRDREFSRRDAYGSDE